MTNRHPLGTMLRLYRVDRNLNVRALAPEIGVSAATLNRIERGHDCDAQTLMRVLAWMVGQDRPTP